VLGARCRVSGAENQVSGPGFQVSGWEKQMSEAGCRVSGAREKVPGAGCQVSGVRCGRTGVGCQVSEPGCESGSRNRSPLPKGEKVRKNQPPVILIPQPREKDLRSCFCSSRLRRTAGILLPRLRDQDDRPAIFSHLPRAVYSLRTPGVQPKKRVRISPQREGQKMEWLTRVVEPDDRLTCSGSETLPPQRAGRPRYVRCHLFATGTWHPTPDTCSAAPDT
jgi:hypothetical protein